MQRYKIRVTIVTKDSSFFARFQELPMKKRNRRMICIIMMYIYNKVIYYINRWMLLLYFLFSVAAMVRKNSCPIVLIVTAMIYIASCCKIISKHRIGVSNHVGMTDLGRFCGY